MGSEPLHEGGVHDRMRLQELVDGAEDLRDSDRHAIRWALVRLGELEAEVERLQEKPLTLREVRAAARRASEQVDRNWPEWKRDIGRFEDGSEVDKEGGSGGDE